MSMSAPLSPAPAAPVVGFRDQVFYLPAWQSLPLVQVTSSRQLSFDELLARYQRKQSDVAWAEQVHGADAAVVTAADRGRERATCDGLITQEAALPLAIRTADCAPVFFYDPAHRAIGIAHVGWRGLAADLPTAMVKAFRKVLHAGPADLLVGFGPTIRSCCYEVQADVAELLRDDCEFREQRIMLDLPRAIRRRLENAGVRPAQISDGALCTACHLDRCYSVRREGASTGRLLSLLILK